jgi:hypothetical protein
VIQRISAFHAFLNPSFSQQRAALEPTRLEATEVEIEQRWLYEKKLGEKHSEERKQFEKCKWMRAVCFV